MVLTKLDDTIKAKGLSDEQVAAGALMSLRSVANAKKGRGVSLNSGKRIAKFLKVKLEDLIATE